jgi:hypothetical protein
LRTVVWRNLAVQGSDYCSLWRTNQGWLLQGIAITILEDGRPMRADYEIHCDPLWQTRQVAVERMMGSERNSVDLTRDPSGAWHGSEEELSALHQCMDIDLAVTPATNTLPIRRLMLEVGQSRDVTAAWLRFPSLALEILLQRYTRLDSQRYLYQSGTGFSAELLVDDFGLVTFYPGGWERLASL